MRYLQFDDLSNVCSVTLSEMKGNAATAFKDLIGSKGYNDNKDRLDGLAKQMIITYEGMVASLAEYVDHLEDVLLTESELLD